MYLIIIILLLDTVNIWLTLHLNTHTSHQYFVEIFYFLDSEDIFFLYFMMYQYVFIFIKK